jgi:hypothetical protein
VSKALAVDAVSSVAGTITGQILILLDAPVSLAIAGAVAQLVPQEGITSSVYNADILQMKLLI